MTPAADIGIRIEVVMLELCTATVISMPIMIATNPPPRPRTAFIERSSRWAISVFMFLVMKISDDSTTIRPMITIDVPRTVRLSVKLPRKSLIQPTGSFTHFLIGLSHSAPADPTSLPLNHAAESDSTWVASSSGSRIATRHHVEEVVNRGCGERPPELVGLANVPE